MNNKYKSFSPNDISQQELHAYLLSAVAPRPICLASTIDFKGNVNLSPFSFFNVFSSNPPIMIFSPARSGRDGSLKHTLQNVLEVPEVVINIVSYNMVEQMSLASTAYKQDVNEFVKTGFREIESEKVRPPRVDKAPVSFECFVTKVIDLGNFPGAGNLIIAEVTRIHINENYLDEKGQLDIRELDLIGRMGGNWYTRSNGTALFEIPKPNKNQGIGVDNLPKEIRTSPILTENNLGRLGNLPALPNISDIEKMKINLEVIPLLEKFSDEQLNIEIHRLAQ